MKYLYIDESGDHNLLPNKIDPTFPLFVLAGIVFDGGEYKKLQKDLIRLKKQIFKTEKVMGVIRIRNSRFDFLQD